MEPIIFIFVEGLQAEIGVIRRASTKDLGSRMSLLGLP